jgi:hypothetical protein
MHSKDGKIVPNQPLPKEYFWANEIWLTSAKIEVDMGMSPKLYHNTHDRYAPGSQRVLP